MQPILISFSVILIGVVAAVLLFSVAMRGREEEGFRVPTRAPTSSGRFFLDEVAGPVGALDVPSDALRIQLERHVRLERETAESFLLSPSAASLQAPSASALRR